MKLSPRLDQINVRLSSDLKAALFKAAEAQHRTVSALVELLIFEHLKAQGYVPTAKKRKK